jgi:hypothetical protein
MYVLRSSSRGCEDVEKTRRNVGRPSLLAHCLARTPGRSDERYQWTAPWTTPSLVPTSPRGFSITQTSPQKSMYFPQPVQIPTCAEIESVGSLGQALLTTTRGVLLSRPPVTRTAWLSASRTCTRSNHHARARKHAPSQPARPVGARVRRRIRQLRHVVRGVGVG